MLPTSFERLEQWLEHGCLDYKPNQQVCIRDSILWSKSNWYTLWDSVPILNSDVAIAGFSYKRKDGKLVIVDKAIINNNDENLNF